MEKIVKITGMHCGGCSAAVEGALEKLAFVEEVSVSHETGLATMQVNEAKYDEKKVVKAVEKAGFKVED